ncbi:MAG: Mut7-C RNAse domain-containing protein [Chloroflexota bacterium]|nr:MAG: Mut7-C RNAse domain-containing protein [Chloroflexota bacterium]
MDIKFIIDNNVGKLAKWLRIMGYDALLFTEEDDGKMVKLALAQNRIILTKDTQIMRRRLVTSGRLKAILIEDDDSKAQLHQVVEDLDLDYQFRPFSVCLECNQNLVERDKEEVRDLVPPYVFETQSLYMECPSCHRIYWRGTHWQAMNQELARFTAQQ